MIKKYDSTNPKFGYNISYGGGNISKNVNLLHKNNLEEIMKQEKLSYGMLSKKTGLGRSTLYKISNFHQSPTQESMIMIAKGLNMPVTDIFDLSIS